MLGHVSAFFLYDAAEVIDLAAVATLIGGTSRVQLTPKTATFACASTSSRR